jgi:hypothetical protein
VVRKDDDERDKALDSLIVIQGLTDADSSGISDEDLSDRIRVVGRTQA